ncbi:MAG TPA: acyltransferase family protein [Ruminiclostridium sp.]
MKSRVAYIDLLKVIAIFGVITIHISSSALYQFGIASIDWYFSVFWASIVRWSVPVFLMCSGVLFLNPDKVISIKRIFTKYLPRIVTALVFWAIMYEMFDVFKVFHNTGRIDSAIIRTAIKNILTCNTHFHLYYLYIIILIYALVPIIKVFSNAAIKHQMEYALFAWIIFGIIYPFAIKFYPLNLLKGIVVQYSISMAYSAIGYFVLGHYFHKYNLTKRTTYIIYALGIIGLAATLYGTIAVSTFLQAVNTMFLEGMSPNVAAMAAGLFLFAKNLHSNADNELSRKTQIIGYISKGSFCVYLVHDFFNIAFRTFKFDTVLNPLFSIPLLSLLNLILSLSVYLVLSKIPVVKKYLI